MVHGLAGLDKDIVTNAERLVTMVLHFTNEPTNDNIYPMHATDSPHP